MAQLAKSVDVSKLRYSELRSLSSGAKTVYVNYGTSKLTIQTPVLSIPYGIGLPYENKEATKSGSVPIDKEMKYDLTVSFRGMDENPKIKLFHDKMKEIENKIVDDAFQNRLAWFKDDFDGNKSFVSKLFSPIVKVDKDPTTGKILGKYPPTFKAKLPYDNKTSTFTFESYDMENNELNFTEIMNKLKGAKAQLIIQLNGIWFAGGKYGCTWKIISAKFQLHQSMKISFIEDSDTEKVDEEEQEEDEDVLPAELIPEASKPKLIVDDDDDEEEKPVKKSAKNVEEDDGNDNDDEDEDDVKSDVSEEEKPVKKSTKKTEDKPVKKTEEKPAKKGAKK